MTVLQEFRDKADQIGVIGDEVRAEARAMGVPSYYIDESIGEGIVEELPDGRKHLIPAGRPLSKDNEQAA